MSLYLYVRLAFIIIIMRKRSLLRVPVLNKGTRRMCRFKREFLKGRPTACESVKGPAAL